MLAFAGQQISPHMIMKKSGTLVCTNVAICRTGTMTYRKSEVTGEPSDEPVEIIRDAAEVLDPVSIASYEGVPICDGHPATFLTPENWCGYSRGHLQNCRIATLPSGERCIVADLVVEDRALIEKILTGAARDVSAGYACVYRPLQDGRYAQTMIRANHLAIVAAGRANQGHRDEVKIYDSAVAIEEAENFGEMMRRYHRRPVLSISPSPRVRAHHAPAEHIEGRVMDMDQGDWGKMSPEQMVRAINSIRDGAFDGELRTIQGDADFTATLMTSGVGPGGFAAELAKRNSAYAAFSSDQEKGKAFEEEARAAGAKMQGRCVDAAPVRIHRRGR